MSAKGLSSFCMAGIVPRQISCDNPQSFGLNNAKEFGIVIA